MADIVYKIIGNKEFYEGSKISSVSANGTITFQHPPLLSGTYYSGVETRLDNRFTFISGV